MLTSIFQHKYTYTNKYWKEKCEWYPHIICLDTHTPVPLSQHWPDVKADSKQPKANSKQNRQQRQDPVREKVTMLQLHFICIHFFWDYWWNNGRYLCFQYFLFGVEDHLDEGVQQGRDHPDVDHLHVRCGWQTLGDTNKTREWQYSDND